MRDFSDSTGAGRAGGRSPPIKAIRRSHTLCTAGKINGERRKNIRRLGVLSFFSHGPKDGKICALLGYFPALMDIPHRKAFQNQHGKRQARRLPKVLRAGAIAIAITLALAVTAGAADLASGGALFRSIRQVWSDGYETRYEAVDREGNQLMLSVSQGARNEMRSGGRAMVLCAAGEEVDITGAIAEDGAYHFEKSTESRDIQVDVTGSGAGDGDAAVTDRNAGPPPWSRTGQSSITDADSSPSNLRRRPGSPERIRRGQPENFPLRGATACAAGVRAHLIPFEAGAAPLSSPALPAVCFFYLDRFLTGCESGFSRPLRPIRPVRKKCGQDVLSALNVPY